ncbi:MAG: allantoinase AllB [Planctomycetota bacterium]
MNLVLRSTRVHLPEETAACDLVIEGERVSSIDPHGAHRDTEATIDVGDLVVMPGLVDSHVHLNAPGRSHWEGFETGTRAAKAGGITTLVDMPLNSSPVTTTKTALDVKREEANGKAHVDVAFYAGLIPGNATNLAELIRAGAVAAKAFLCHSGLDEFPNVSETDLRTAMPILKQLNVPLLVHAELVHAVPAMKNPRRYADYLESRPRSFERNAIESMIELADQTGCHVHIVHLADGECIEVIASAKRSGVPITVETCPHYLCIDSDSIEDGQTEFKCAPPIRGHEDREALWQGLRDGTIEMIVSDHSPCPPEMKHSDTGRFDQAWGGISSLQIGLPLVWTEAVRRGFTLHDVIRWMSSGPASLVKIDQGIQIGAAANLVVFDPDTEWTVRRQNLHHRHPVTPYHGKRLRGVVRRTYVHGRDDDQPRGKVR